MRRADEGRQRHVQDGQNVSLHYCFKQRKKTCSAKTVGKDEIEARVEDIIAYFLADPEMLASLTVDLADHCKKTHGRGDEILETLEARHFDVEAKLANFVKATLYEDEASIGTFYKRFAEATIDTVKTRDQLFEYFVNKIYIRPEQVVIASYFHDRVAPIKFEDFEATLFSGDRARKCEPTLESAGSTLPLHVEMAGIEPASDDACPSILRVQFAVRCFRPQRSREQVADRPSSVKVPS